MDKGWNQHKLCSPHSLYLPHTNIRDRESYLWDIGIFQNFWKSGFRFRCRTLIKKIGVCVKLSIAKLGLLVITLRCYQLPNWYIFFVKDYNKWLTHLSTSSLGHILTKSTTEAWYKSTKKLAELAPYWGWVAEFKEPSIARLRSQCVALSHVQTEAPSPFGLEASG